MKFGNLFLDAFNAWLDRVGAEFVEGGTLDSETGTATLSAPSAAGAGISGTSGGAGCKSMSSAARLAGVSREYHTIRAAT